MPSAVVIPLPEGRARFEAMVRARIPFDLDRRVQIQAAREDRTVAQLLRRALWEYLHRHSPDLQPNGSEALAGLVEDCRELAHRLGVGDREGSR